MYLYYAETKAIFVKQEVKWNTYLHSATFFKYENILENLHKKLYFDKEYFFWKFLKCKSCIEYTKSISNISKIRDLFTKLIFSVKIFLHYSIFQNKLPPIQSLYVGDGTYRNIQSQRIISHSHLWRQGPTYIIIQCVSSCPV